MLSSMGLETSGVLGFDDLLGGGLAAGDNVVWVGDDRAVITRFAQRFIAAPGPGHRLHVDLGPGPDHVEVPPSVEVVDLGRSRQPTIDPEELEAALLGGAVDHGSRLVVDGLDQLILRWGAREAARFYTRVCPRLFDRGAIAYWIGTRAVSSASFIDEVARVAQCVFELRQGRLRVTKAEGRPARLQGAMVTVDVDADGDLVLSQRHAAGRVGEGLVRVRRARDLTQAQLARMAGVTPAAVSQAESGRRGLSLDTLLVLSEQLGIGLDDLLGGSGQPDYVLARRDRHPTEAGATPLLDEQGGLRVHVVHLEPGEHGTPPGGPHKGVELVLVANGLVLVDLGHTTPAVRAGDAVMATKVTVKGWTSLGPEPARLFWLVLG
jgi:transcriptional regulator with XRE-family HTH domain